MISPAHASLMAQYNQWQNGSLYLLADGLSDAQRTEDRGAFFGSLQMTLAHILWADRVWMNRFAGTPATGPEDAGGQGKAYQDWRRLKDDRKTFDETISSWAGELNEEWLRADFTWWNTTRTRRSTQPAWRLVAHFFNHQTHHRGQAHALLTYFGAETTSTDLLFTPDEI